MSQQYALPSGPPLAQDPAAPVGFPSQHPPPEPGSQPVSGSGKKRKSSKPKALADLRRVASLPQIRNLAMPEGGPLSPNSDKRRNKLGYHRTSVACGHCRRRKIRCLLPSPEDPQGRCANCIRLKKECQFYSVTEAPQHERPSGKKSGPPTASNSPSPRTTGPRALGNQDESEQAQGYPIGHSAEEHGYAQSPISSSVSGGVYPDPQYHYPSYPASEAWHSENFPSPSTAAHQHNRPEPPSPYWSGPQASHPSSYQQHVSDPSGQPGGGGTDYGPRNFQPPPPPPQGWTQPRSMSLGQVENLPSHYQYQHGYPQQHSSAQQTHRPYVAQYGQTSHSTVAHQLSPPASSAQNFPSHPVGWQGLDPQTDLAGRDLHDDNYGGQYYSDQRHQHGAGEQAQSNSAQFASPGLYYPPTSHTG